MATVAPSSEKETEASPWTKLSPSPSISGPTCSRPAEGFCGSYS